MTAPDLPYLALGDSYTIGEGVPAAERWPARLADALRAEGVPVAEPVVVARTGWTTDELWAAMDATELHPPYALVSLLIGVNNQYRGRTVEEYAQEFARLLARAVELANGVPERVLVLSIPDWGVTPFAAARDRGRIAEEIDRFNAAGRSAVQAAGAAWVDVTPVSRARGAEPTMLAADGLHPSGSMYLEWARLALPAARGALAAGESAGR